MKLLLLKCSICSCWFHAHRAHCPICGAARLNDKLFVNAQGVQVVRAFVSDIAFASPIKQ